MGKPALRLDVPAADVRINGQRVNLTRKEFELLTLMCQNSGLLVSRDQIFREVWGWDFVGGTKTLDMHVVTLRKKLGFNGSNSPITTIRGKGFRLETDQIELDFVDLHDNGDGIKWWIRDGEIVMKIERTPYGLVKLTLDDLTKMINRLYG